MEPIDIDKIIRDKIVEGSDLHEQEMDSAKPFVWATVQNNIGKKKSLTWYHLAAAIILLLIGFSFVLYGVLNKHSDEIRLLSDKLGQLQKNHVSQADLVKSKDQEVESLGNELKQVQQKFTNLAQQKPIAQKEIFVYRTDTVYLKQIEYITAIPDPTDQIVIATDKKGEQTEQIESAILQERKIDEAIYPSKLKMGKRQQSEPIVFKFGSLTARKD